MISLSIEEVVDAARNEVVTKIKKGLFTGNKDVNNSGEVNAQMIQSTYSQWVENQNEASNAIYRMIRKEFSRNI